MFYKREDVEGLSDICPVEKFMSLSYGSTCKEMKNEEVSDEKNVNKFADFSRKGNQLCKSSMDIEDVNVNVSESPSYVQRESLGVNCVRKYVYLAPNNNSPRTPLFVSRGSNNSSPDCKNTNLSYLFT
jgi:hypothetical protein